MVFTIFKVVLVNIDQQQVGIRATKLLPDYHSVNKHWYFIPATSGLFLHTPGPITTLNYPLKDNSVRTARSPISRQEIDADYLVEVAPPDQIIACATITCCPLNVSAGEPCRAYPMLKASLTRWQKAASSWPVSTR